MKYREVTASQLKKGFVVLVGGRGMRCPYRLVSRKGGHLIVEEPEVKEVTTTTRTGVVLTDGRRFEEIGEPESRL